MVSKLNIGFLGTGKMATALAKGLIRAEIVTPAHVIGSDVSEAASAAFAKETGAKVANSNNDVAKAADVLILAVKPDQVPGALGDIRDHLTEKHLLISIA